MAAEASVHATSNASYQGGATVSLSAVEIYNDIALGALVAFQTQAEQDYIDTLRYDLLDGATSSAGNSANENAGWGP